MNDFNEKIVLGIETSCDETAIAIYHSKRGLLAHCLNSQIKIHKKYGGVMPEVASRDHIRHITPLIKQTLSEANIGFADIDAVAYTAGPGLAGSLMVGASVARSLAYSLQIDAIAVHHMEGHLLAPMLDSPTPEYPFVALLISGGHTLLIEVLKVGNYQIIGESVDDALGEAFDKTARLLGLPYPGGPELQKLAMKGMKGRFVFPRPMIKHKGLNFSFSGLKTHVMTEWQKSDKSEQTRADIALAFEVAVAETLKIKCKRALSQTELKSLVVAGGVSANLRIKSYLKSLGEELNVKIFFPRLEFCTDNAAMIAFAGTQHLNNPQKNLEILAKPRWVLDSHIYD